MNVGLNIPVVYVQSCHGQTLFSLTKTQLALVNPLRTACIVWEYVITLFFFYLFSTKI